MKITENLLLRCSSYLFTIVLISLLQTSDAMNSHICSPSSCGHIRNISFPFRLKHDPKHCGYRDYELECENNITTVLYLNSQKYKVKAISYHNFTIRLADVSMNSSCSFPKHFPYIEARYPYGIWSIRSHTIHEVAWPIHFINCPYPLKSSSLLTELATYNCDKDDKFLKASNSSNSAKYTYVKVGQMRASDVEYMCRTELIALTSWKFEDLKNVSVSEIDDSLFYGFELYWLKYQCSKCKRRSYCILQDDDYNMSCSEDSFLDHLYLKWAIIRYYITRHGGPHGERMLSLLFVAVVLFAGIIIPAKIIIAFIYVLGFLTIDYMVFVQISLNWTLQYVRPFIGLIFAARFIILFPFVMWFLIYKFRRRHESMFDAIECFLKSDNKLVPIRYSYSDIKKMTRGFREKIGEGGYGSVYKGKLRSGLDVAVKLLGKPGGNGQDFMNEIATIGRIHHVNVVNLVGYCAERSKRALVFDFMPNGSLDKYIYTPEKRNSLSWERKYEIAVGVARGIEYLHRGCDIQILHFDIKPHNILLDDNFTPKIADFGLAKLFSTDKKLVTLSAVRGTIGYVAPELINRGFGGVSYKADVYSFGMLLIEIVGLKRDLRENNQTFSKYFPCWIYDCFEQGKDIEIGETDVNNNNDGNNNDGNNNDFNREIARKMTIVALWCIQMSPDDRPSMNKVVQMLEGQVERLRVPSRPSQSAQVVVNYADQSWTTYSTDSMSLLHNDDVPSIEIAVVNV